MTELNAENRLGYQEQNDTEALSTNSRFKANQSATPVTP
jgi:hypothetical protein